MAGPIQLPDGTTIEGYDAASVRLRAPSGERMITMRATAPAQIQDAVNAAERPGGATLSTSPAVQNPLGFVEGVPDQIGGPSALPPPGPTRLQQAMRSQSPAVAAQAAPVITNPTAAAAPIEPTPQDELSAINDRIQQLRSQPQTAAGGGGVRTTTQTTGYDPATTEAAAALQGEARAGQEQASAAQQNATLAESYAQQEKARIAAEDAKKIEDAHRAQEVDRLEYNKRYTVEQQKFEDLRTSADKEIDPDHYWKDKGTGGRILAAISIGLGAYGAARTGSRNYALDIIDNAIQRDVDSQLANQKNKRAGAADQAGYMQMIQERYSETSQQRLAALSLYHEQSAKQIEAIGAQLTSEQLKSRAAELAGVQREKAAKESQALLLNLAGQTTTTKTAVPGGVGPSRAKLEADALEAAAYTKFDPEALVPAAESIMGVPMQAIEGKEDARKLNETMAASSEFLRKLDQMEALGKSKLSPSARTSMKSLRALALLDIKTMSNGGALDAGMQKIAEDALGPSQTDVTTITSAVPNLRTTVHAQLRGFLKNRAVPANPNAIPLTMRSRFSPSGGTSSGPPQTQPLAESEVQ